MFVYNRCTTDARVLKEATSLVGAGHSVRIVAVLDPTTEPVEERDGFRIVRIDRNPIHYRILGTLRRVQRALRIGASQAAVRTHETREARGPLRAIVALPGAVALAAARLLRAPLGSVVRKFDSTTRRLLLVPHKPLMFLDYYARAYRLVRSSPPEALHAHDLNTLPVAALLARRLRLPLTYDAHELYPEISTLSARESAVWRLVERRLAKRATSIVTVCESIAGEIEQRNQVRRPLVLLNCPSSSAGAGEGAAELHALVDVPELEPIVLYQGGFAPHRGLATTGARGGRVRGRCPRPDGLGAPGGRAAGRSSAARACEQRVRVTGPVPREEVVSYAAAATIGLIPYEPVGLNNTYTTPNKLFDYMVAGLPMAASRLPELVRFVEGGEIGATFEPGSSSGLAASVNDLIAAPERAGPDAGAGGGAAALDTWEREAAKLLALYADRG